MLAAMDSFTRIDDFWFRVEAALAGGHFWVTHVGGTRTTPSWAYTIGFLARGFPEMVTIGLSPQSSHAFLNFAFEQMKLGAPLEEGRVHRRVCWNDLPLAAVPLAPDRFVPPSDLMNALFGYYEARGGLPAEPRVSQLVWPDMEGRLPWDPGFDESLRIYQPLLDEVAWTPNHSDHADDDHRCSPSTCFFAEEAG
jgi:hypothetical protein